MDFIIVYFITPYMYFIIDTMFTQGINCLGHVYTRDKVDINRVCHIKGQQHESHCHLYLLDSYADLKLYLVRNADRVPLPIYDVESKAGDVLDQ